MTERFAALLMSQFGTKPTSRDVSSVGAKGPKADIRPSGQNRRE
jgi:hypothetical protein